MEEMAEQDALPTEVAHPALADPVLRRFAAEVQGRYGEWLERLVLFGSRARGDHGPDSDYDVAVFLHGFTTGFGEIGPLSEIAMDALLNGVEISAKPFPAGAWKRDEPLMDAIAQDGLDLCGGGPGRPPRGASSLHAADGITRARRALAAGTHLLSVDCFDGAVRSARDAAHHAAWSFVVHRTGRRAIKSEGTGPAFVRLADGGASAFASLLWLHPDDEFDFEDGEGATREDASAAMNLATRMVDAVEAWGMMDDQSA